MSGPYANNGQRRTSHGGPHYPRLNGSVVIRNSSAIRKRLLSKTSIMNPCTNRTYQAALPLIHAVLEASEKELTMDGQARPNSNEVSKPFLLKLGELKLEKEE